MKIRKTSTFKTTFPNSTGKEMSKPNRESKEVGKITQMLYHHYPTFRLAYTMTLF
jgi:hypothetical protein